MNSSQESEEVQIVSVCKRQKVIKSSDSDVIDLTRSGKTNISANSRSN